MQSAIVVIHLMVVLVLVGTVLLQRSEGGGLGAGNGAGVMTGRGTANLLTRTTAVMAAGLFATSLLLSWMAALDRGHAPLVGAQSRPAGVVQGAPAAGGVLDALRSADGPQSR